MSRIIGVLLSLPFLAIAAIFGAIELGGEVVVLETTSARGDKFTTSLWVVDIEDSPVLRAGSATAEWLTRIRAEPSVALIRDEIRTQYEAEIIPSYADQVNVLMRDEYGFADRIVSVLHDKNEVVAVRLVEP